MCNEFLKSHYEYLRIKGLIEKMPKAHYKLKLRKNGEDI